MMKPGRASAHTLAYGKMLLRLAFPVLPFSAMILASFD